MEDHEDAVVILSGWNLIELTVWGESEQPALFAKDRTVMMQVPLVSHNNYGCLVEAKIVLIAFNGLNESGDSVETGSVTDAVHQHEAICPLDSFLAQVRLRWQVLLNNVYFP